jgi:sigma-E factor negative regulatory protein RseA
MDRISSLMDGEFDAHQAEQQLACLTNDAHARECWDTFHLIGDAMRGEYVVSKRFTGLLHARLAQEPTVLAPRRSHAKHVAAYAWSAAASVSAVALVGWIAFYSPLAPQSQVATGPLPVQSIPAVPAALPEQLASEPSDGKMNEYLIAHQEFSPSTAIQGLAPYIRGVSATQVTKGRE